MPKTKEVSLNLRKIIIDFDKAGDGYTKLSWHFQLLRTGVRSVIKKYKERHTDRTSTVTVMNSDVSVANKTLLEPYL